MRKNAFLADCFRQVKTTLSRFLSILIITVLGVSFFAGLRTTGTDMRITASAYFDSQHFMDFRLLSTMGFDDDDIAAIKGVKGVKGVMPAYFYEALVKLEDKNLTVIIHSLSEEQDTENDLNRPRIIEGRMPENIGECLADPQFISATGLRIGDKVRFSSGTSDPLSDALKREEYEIVGIAESPLYISYERGSSSIGSGRTDTYFYLPSAAFSLPVYTEVYLTVQNDSNLSRFDDGYEDLLKAVTDALEKTEDIRARVRFEEIRDEAREEIEQAKKEVDEGYQKLSDAQKELEDGRKELDKGWQEYRDGLKKYENEISKAKKELEKGWQEYYEGLERFEKEISDARKELDDGWNKYYDGVLEFETKTAQARKELDDAWTELQDGWLEYYKGLDEFNIRISQEEKKLNEGYEEYYKGLSQYRQGLESYNRGYDELKKAQREYDAALSEYNQGLEAYNQSKALYDALNGALAAGNTPQSLAVITMIANEISSMNPGLSSVLLAYAANPDDPIVKAAAEGAVSQFGQYLDGIKQELDAAKAMLDEGKVKLDNGWNELNRASSRLDRAKEELDEAKRKLDEGKQELEKAKTEGRKELDEAREKLLTGEAQLFDGEAKFAEEKAKGEKELADALRELNEGEAALLDAKAKGEQELSDALTALKDGEAQLAREEKQGGKDLAEARIELTKGETEYADAKREYEEERKKAEIELSDAEKKIEDAEKELAQLKPPEWYILDHSTNVGFVSYKQDTERIDALSVVVPLFFFLVAILVTMTSMTRLVESDRQLIGTFKALGYGNLAIAARYLMYAISASLIGGVLGIFAGYNVFPRVIFNAYSIMYTLPPVLIKYDVFYGVASTLIAVACAALPALAVCYKSLVSVPAQLMRPTAPPKGKRTVIELITPIWKRLNFSQKVAVRNLFRYKKRFIMTVVGVAGCTALMFTGFGLRDSITTIVAKQYDTIHPYDLKIDFKKDANEDEKESLFEKIERSGTITSYTGVMQLSVDAVKDGKTKSAFLIVPESLENIEEFIKLQERKSKKELDIPDDGAIVTEKLASLFGLKVGDELILRDSDGSEAAVKIKGIAENYLFHYIYMTPSYYRASFGQEPYTNQVLCHTEENQSQNNDLSESLLNEPAVNSITFTENLKTNFGKMVGALNYVVLVLIVSAAALVYVVLFCLTTINLEERNRELATIKVLGFYNNELAAYIYRENVVMTVLGTLIGLLLGVALQRYVITTMEIDFLMFSRDLRWQSYIYSSGLTFVFAFLVNLIMFRRIVRIDMISSLKSVE